MEKQCSLYRHFDKDGKLLYVGISKCAIKRFRSHEKSSTWSRDVATIKIEWFASTNDAMAAERIAIIEEKPIWNIHHNNRNKVIEHSPPSDINHTYSIEEINQKRNKIYRQVSGPAIKSKIALRMLGFENMVDYKKQYIFDWTLPPYFRVSKTIFLFKEDHLRIHNNISKRSKTNDP